MHRRYIVYRDLKPANILLDENGHVRISDLGLACDYSKKKPHASVGTHGYMAPEVLSKGTPYDSSADWFSFGCMLYKLLKGHSPFRQHKTKDKHEIDRMTLTMVSGVSWFSSYFFSVTFLRTINLKTHFCTRYSSELLNFPFSALIPKRQTSRCVCVCFFERSISQEPHFYLSLVILFENWKMECVCLFVSKFKCWAHSAQKKFNVFGVVFFFGHAQNVELPDSFSKELKCLLEGLLMRDVDKRLGCKGRG